MTSSDGDRAFPQALTAVAGATFDYGDGDGVDYEPYEEFLSAEETTGWLRAWTGNGGVDGGAFRVFGQDGTGGYAAFWLVRPGRPLADQPVVFLGSEGEHGVVARDLASYLWLLADGSGPYEAVEYPERDSSPKPELAAIAARYASGLPRPASTVITEAVQEFPDFGRTIDALRR